MTMTKQEYDAKTANGTLTVRDVLDNREHATPEQLAAFGTFAHVPPMIKAEQAFYSLYLDLFALLSDVPEQFGTAQYLDDWGNLTEPTPRATATATAATDILEKLNTIRRKIDGLLNSEDLPSDKREQLTRFGAMIDTARETTEDITHDNEQ